MQSSNKDACGTVLAPEAVIVEVSLSASNSSKKSLSAQNHNKKGHEIDKTRSSTLQISQGKTVKSPGSRLEPRPKSEPSQDCQTDGPISLFPISVKAELSEFKFNREALKPELFSANYTKQTASEKIIRFSLSPPSEFNFSSAQTEIFSPTTTISQRVNSSINLQKEKAQKLQQCLLTRDTLIRILPVAAFDRLIENQVKCISLTREGNRCSRKISDSKNEVPNLLESIASLDVQKNWSTVYQKLMRVVEILLCSRSHRGRAKEELEALNDRLIKSTNERRSKVVNPSEDPNRAIVEHWLKTVCRNSDKKVAKLRELQGPGETVEQIQYVRQFSPFPVRRLQGLSEQQAIEEAIRRPLTNRELEAKYLYIFWIPGNFGYVKIGVSNCPADRFKGWKGQCKHDVREHFQHDSGENILVKHAYRVEKLVQVELKALRFQQIGCPCNKTHNEWFRTTPDHATKVIKKFSDWMATSPYQHDKRGCVWELNKQIEESKINELCEPIAPGDPKTSPGLVKRRIPLRQRPKLPRGKH